MEENKSLVCVYGLAAQAVPVECCCGGEYCAEPAPTMQEAAAEIAAKLKDFYGDRVDYKFIAVRISKQNYPEIVKKYLPMTVINGKLRFYAGLDEGLIVEAVQEQLDKANKVQANPNLKGECSDERNRLSRICVR